MDNYREDKSKPKLLCKPDGTWDDKAVCSRKYIQLENCFVKYVGMASNLY